MGSGMFWKMDLGLFWTMSAGLFWTMDFGLFWKMGPGLFWTMGFGLFWTIDFGLFWTMGFGFLHKVKAGHDQSPSLFVSRFRSQLHLCKAQLFDGLGLYKWNLIAISWAGIGQE